MTLKEQLIQTSQELKLVRIEIRRLKVYEDSLCNRLERLLIENQTEITFEDEQERDNGQPGIPPTSGSDGFDSVEIV